MGKQIWERSPKKNVFFTPSLIDVDGHGPNPEQLDAIHGEVLLLLVEDAHNDVIVVALLFLELRIEDPHLCLRRPVKSEGN